MHILVTNDDGVTAPGLLTLAQEMRKLGKVSVLAPDRGSDIGALAEGFVSVTPIQLDLTTYQVMPDLNTWEWSVEPARALALTEAFTIFLPG